MTESIYPIASRLKCSLHRPSLFILILLWNALHVPTRNYKGSVQGATVPAGSRDCSACVGRVWNTRVVDRNV